MALRLIHMPADASDRDRTIYPPLSTRVARSTFGG
jgi:hypothetical protein